MINIMKNAKFLIIVLLIIAAFVVGRTSNKFTGEKAKVAGVQTETGTGKEVEFSPKKSDKPSFKFFVMSFCPYGNQAEAGIKPVFDLLKDKVDWEPHYIVDKSNDAQIKEMCKNQIYDEAKCKEYINQGYFPNLDACKQRFYKTEAECFEKTTAECLATKDGNYYCSLHGRKELNQDIRELCAAKIGDQGKWWQFVSLVNQNCQLDVVDQCWTAQAQQAGFDTNKIQECFTNEAINLLDKEFSASSQFNVSGSPTVLINDTAFPPEGAYDEEGKATMKIGKSSFAIAEYRSPEGLKSAVCAAFAKAPAECEKELSRTNEVGSGGSCN